MWPFLLLDMTKEESIQILRNLELEAYSSLVSALRAQGSLSQEKRKLLKELSSILNITHDRHKAEVRRAISDEKLNTIAYHITGQSETIEDWALEGRRIVPLLPRVVSQTSCSVIADEVSQTEIQQNKQLSFPSSTERKRITHSQAFEGLMPECSKSQPFCTTETSKNEESKKRKLCLENSNLAQHLMGPKLSKIQQIYRHSSKASRVKMKDHQKNTDLFQNEVLHSIPDQQSMQNNTKIIDQNMQAVVKDNDVYQEKNQELTPNLGICSYPNSSKPISAKTSLNTNMSLNNSVLIPGMPKSIKICPPKKNLAKSINAGQKLIVVSSAQNIPTTSILQKTLSVPINKMTKLNFDKFKIMSNSSVPSTIQVTTVVNSQNTDTMKHKVVTLKTNPGKKMIPLSQLQMLNSKGGIKVLPLGGKIIGKTLVSTASPMIVMSTPQHMVKVSMEKKSENDDEKSKEGTSVEVNTEPNTEATQMPYSPCEKKNISEVDYLPENVDIEKSVDVSETMTVKNTEIDVDYEIKNNSISASILEESLEQSQNTDLNLGSHDK